MKDKVALKWISSKFEGLRLAYAFLLFLSVLKGALTVFLALAIKWIINVAEGTMQGDLVTYAVILIATSILEVLSQMLMRYVREKIRCKLEVNVKNYVFSQVLSKDYAKITAYHSGDILNRIFSDTTVIANHSVGILPELVLMITRLIGAVGVLIFLNPIFTVALVGCGALVFLCASLFRNKIKTAHKRVQHFDGKARSYMQESTANLLAVKVFNAEKTVSEKSTELTKDYFDRKMKNEKLHIFAESGFSLFFSVAYAVALVWGAFGIFAGTLDYGTVSAVLQLVVQVQVPLIRLSGVMPGYYSMLASAERLIEIENLPTSEKAEKIDDIESFYKKFNGVAFKNVTFSYGRDAVIENADFQIEKGQFTVIRGISGIGKSTVLKLMLGVYRPNEGQVVFSTEDGTLPPQMVTGLFSYVPQGNMLFSGTLRENVCFVKPDASDEEIFAVLELTESKEFVEQLPEGLETKVGENGLGLSEGQIQRLAVARALLTDAPVVLLDEATSALDSKTEEKLLSSIRALGNKTVVLVTHKTAAYAYCDKIIEISDKKVEIK